MPKKKQQKAEILTKMKTQLDSLKSAVFVNFSGIPVKELDILRKDLRDQNVEYTVAKKTLLKKALSESNYQVEEMGFNGEVGAAFAFGDEVAPAKTIAAFMKDHQNMKVLGGILEKKYISQNEVIALAKLPSKQELLAKAVGSIAAPLSGFVNVLQGNLRNLVYVMNAIKDKKQA